MPKPQRVENMIPLPNFPRRESAWRPVLERQRVLDKYAHTLEGLNELDEEACQVVYVTRPAEPQTFDSQQAQLEREDYVKKVLRALAESLCKEHPDISVDKNIFGGMPHIKGVRLTVGNILAKLYVYGDTQAVLESYAPHVSEEQIKEAIAYAQDFLEMACDPHETP
jgi:uncharacterized protein (DUF433 family)